jgi:hypothetical protein
MAAPCPDHPMLRGVFAPVFVEGESGARRGPAGVARHALPQRAQPAVRSPGPLPLVRRRRDGARLPPGGGRVTYRNRWLRTPKFQLKRAAGHALFGAFGNPAETDPVVRGKDFGVAQHARRAPCRPPPRA